jgi:hypothetical protein
MRTKTTRLKNGTRVTRATTGPLEWEIQAAAVRVLRALPEFNKRFTLAGDFNAGRRGFQQATIAKATGLTAGEHDLRLYLEGGRLGLIEYKAGTGLSQAQRARHALLFGLGFQLQAIVKAASEDDSAQQTLAVVRGWLAANDNQKVEG